MNPRAGRVRYKVVAFAVTMAAITYLDRVSISTLAPAIMRDLHISRVQMGYIFTAFPISYALFEIPTAWWGERVGTRRVLARIVAWWSAFTAATGAVTSYPIMLAVRFLFGAGEAGAWPNAAKAFSRWIPAVELGRVQGMFFMSAHLTGGLAPGIVLILESDQDGAAFFQCWAPSVSSGPWPGIAGIAMTPPNTPRCRRRSWLSSSPAGAIGKATTIKAPGKRCQATPARGGSASATPPTAMELIF